MQHLKGLLEMGAFDAVDREREQEDPEDERLPQSCNKFSLLSRGALLILIDQVIPEVKEWLQSLKTVPKAELCDLLGYLCHCCPKSAVPSRRMGDLKAWCRDRWAKYGQGLSGGKSPEADLSLSQWLQLNGASYWSLDKESDDYMVYVTGKNVKLPESFRIMNVKKVLDELAIILSHPQVRDPKALCEDLRK